MFIVLLKGLSFNASDIPLAWGISVNRSEHLADNQRLSNLNNPEIIMASPEYGVLAVKNK